MSEKKLGKIKSVKFGFGGYQELELGIWFHLSGDGWGVFDGKGFWSGDPGEFTKWTMKDKRETLADVMLYLQGLLKEANVKTVDQLKNIPVEVKLDANLLKGWKILKEVI